jgi:hypothetical protein
MYGLRAGLAGDNINNMMGNPGTMGMMGNFGMQSMMSNTPQANYNSQYINRSPYSGQYDAQLQETAGDKAKSILGGGVQGAATGAMLGGVPGAVVGGVLGTMPQLWNKVINPEEQKGWSTDETRTQANTPSAFQSFFNQFKRNTSEVFR